MARISSKVYGWRPQKGKGKCLTDVYYAIEGNKDTLFGIYKSHKTWGEDWYELIMMGSYQNAKEVLIAKKKASGFSFLVALNCIDDIIHLEAEMVAIEKEIM